MNEWMNWHILPLQNWWMCKTLYYTLQWLAHLKLSDESRKLYCYSSVTGHCWDTQWCAFIGFSALAWRILSSSTTSGTAGMGSFAQSSLLAIPSHGLLLPCLTHPIICQKRRQCSSCWAAASAQWRGYGLLPPSLMENFHIWLRAGGRIGWAIPGCQLWVSKHIGELAPGLCWPLH